MSTPVEISIILAVITLLGFVLPPVITAFINRRDKKNDALQFSTETTKNLAQQIRDLALDIQVERVRGDKLEGQVDELRQELRKFKNGYAKAIRYIYDKDPTAALPNFLTDSNPK